jgi:hypothetical protein
MLVSIQNIRGRVKSEKYAQESRGLGGRDPPACSSPLALSRRCSKNASIDTRTRTEFGLAWCVEREMGGLE